MIGSNFRQSMTWLHTWAGLVVGWVLFFVFLTGTLGYFDTEIDRWMQPERPVFDGNLDSRQAITLAEQYLNNEAPEAKSWRVTLPVNRNHSDLIVRWKPNPEIDHNGAKINHGTVIQTTAIQTLDLNGEAVNYRETGGGQKLYKMHYDLHYVPELVGNILVGICTMFMLVALTTSVIAHRKIFQEIFTFRPFKKQRSWLDIHNIFGVLALPFHFMITYSGLVFFYLTLMPLVYFGVYGNNESKAVSDTKMYPPPIVRSQHSAEMKPLSFFYDKIGEIKGDNTVVETINIDHPNNEAARINVRILTDNFTYSQDWLFDGVTGELIADGEQPTGTVFYRDFLGIHEGLFADISLRWLYFISGIFGTAMIGSGLILWIQKRRIKNLRLGLPIPMNIQLIEKFNIATIVGLPAAIAAYFLANRILPLDLPNRVSAELDVLFVTWLLLTFHALLRSRHHAWMEQLLAAACLFILVPIVNSITTERGLLTSLANLDWVYVSFDFLSGIVGIGFIACAYLYKKYSADSSAATEAEDTPADTQNLAEG